MDDRDIQIGQRIRKFRKDKGLNQSELAEKIGKSLRTVQKYEKGEIEVAVSVISDIAAVLGISSSNILGYKSGIEHIGSLSDIMSPIRLMTILSSINTICQLSVSSVTAKRILLRLSACGDISERSWLPTSLRPVMSVSL